MAIYNFESLYKFNVALREVIILIRRFKLEENKSRIISNIYLKSALILLTAKFEAFLENIFAEYINKLNEELTVNQIPEILKIYHTKEHLEQFSICFQKTAEQEKRDKIIKNMKDLALLWKNDKESKPIKISNKFNYGKHGQESINELFRRIGFKNILNEFEITEKIHTIDGDINENVDFKAKVNELTSKRNSILHNDTSITFTKEELICYIKYLKQFSQKLTNKLFEMSEDYKLIN